MRYARAASSLLIAASLAACAGQKPHVTTAGAFPQQGSYEIAGPASSEQLRQEVSDRLGALQFEASDEADYLLQIGAFERPASVGSLVPDGGEPEWLRSPTLRSGQVVRGLTLNLTERDTGQEVYRVTAQIKEGKGARPDTLDRLIAAALPLPPPPAPAEPR